MCKFNNSMLCAVSYDTVRRAMGGEPYSMSLTEKDEIRAVIAAVNQGIDSHLEACYCPHLGDRYETGQRHAGRIILCSTLECSVSRESLPVLLRRLSELEGDEAMVDAAMNLVESVLTSLGIDEYGVFIGREAMGLL